MRRKFRGTTARWGLLVAAGAMLAVSGLVSLASPLGAVVRGAGNMLRGAFGAALHGLDPAAYVRVFAPSGERPSGLAQRPRPFGLLPSSRLLLYPYPKQNTPARNSTPARRTIEKRNPPWTTPSSPNCSWATPKPRTR